MDERERIQREQAADYIRMLAGQVERGHLNAVKIQWAMHSPYVNAEIVPVQPVDFIALTIDVEPKKEGG